MGQTWDETIKRENHLKEQVAQKDELLRDLQRFLNELPEDIGRGSLNGWRTQLQEKIRRDLNA